MKWFLKAALNNPEPGKGEGGIVYEYPHSPYRENGLVKDRYWRTYYALKDRGLIEYKSRLLLKSSLNDEESFCMACVLTDLGIEEARKLP